MSEKSTTPGNIAEINQHISDALKQWAEIMILADADEWAFRLDYSPMDVFHATMILQHVCSNVGIKSGIITSDERAEFLGSKLRKLVEDMTGLDPAKILDNEKPAEEPKEEPAPILSMSIYDMNVSVRLAACLHAAGCNTVGDILKLSKSDFLKIRNFGKHSLTELLEWLHEHNLSLQ